MAKSLNVQWSVTEPVGTIYKTHYAANYFRPNDWLQEVADDEPWQPGDILIYWNDNLRTNRLRHVNLYVGAFAGVDVDGRIYATDQPCDVVNASIDYRGSQNHERGTRIRGLTKDACLRTKLGRQHVMRLRHTELEGQTDTSTASPSPGVVSIVTERPTEQATADDDFIVSVGQLTFDTEGLEVRGRYFSRQPHVPSNSSGVTLGRGYDMKHKRRTKIVPDLTRAGIDGTLADKFADAAGLEGNAARQFIRRPDIAEIEITPQQQKTLFEGTYEEHAADVKRICDKADVVQRYGRTDWDQLHFAIKDVLVDLRYRGDFTGITRRRVQPSVVANDLDGLKETMEDKAYWVQKKGVPRDRFERRADYMAKVLQELG